MAVKSNDEIWADNNLDGSPHEPIKQDIRRKMNAIEALATAAGVGAEHYQTKALMDADLSQPDGTIGVIYADPVDANNSPAVWVWNDAGNIWVLSVDRIGNMDGRVAQSAAAVDGLYLSTAAPRPLAFADTSTYAQTWVTISNPSTRFTITASAAGYQVVGLPGLGSAWPVGVKLPYDLLPGDSFYIEGKYTAGTISTASGFWIGTDPTTTGDMSTNTRLLVRHNTVLTPNLANGTSNDGARTVTPAFVGPAFANGTVIGIQVDVQADRSLAVKAFQDGLQASGDVTVTPATAAGAVVIGMMIANGQTAIITRITRRVTSGAILYLHSGVSSSGDGTRGAPLKSLNDINAAIVSQGLVGQPITINNLTDNVYGYLEMKESLSPRWTINGIAGGNTTFNGYNFLEAPVWTVVASTGGLVWSTPTKRGQELRSFPNQVFIFGLSWNPRPWYNFPNTTVPGTTTANGGVDMAGKTAGAFAASGGLLYLRLPDGMPSADPNAYPTGGYSIIVSRVLNVLSVTEGRPEVNVNDITLRWSSGPTFLGGAGFGRFTRCRFEWGGYNGPNTESQNGQYVYEACKWKYSDGDCFGRQIRTDVPYQVGSTLIDRLIHCELSHTGRQEISPGVYLGGDGASIHIVEDGTARSLQFYMTDCWVHDTWKCGVPCNADLMVIDGCLIERFGTEGVVLTGVASASGAGRTQRAYIRNTRVDPAGVGTKGIMNSYTDGMALCETQIDNCWIGTPAGGGAELSVIAVALAGQTRDITKNRIVYRNCTTERASGSVVKDGSGVSGTFVAVAANALV